jgi:hypothetical protein
MRRALFGFVAAWAFATSCFGDTLTVDLNGGADHTDIQSAIDAAKDGDAAIVKPGEYVITEPITFKGKAIAVESDSGAEVTTIRTAETPAHPWRTSAVIFDSGGGSEAGREIERRRGRRRSSGLHGDAEEQSVAL